MNSMSLRTHSPARTGFRRAWDSPGAALDRGFAGAPQVDAWLFSGLADRGDAAIFGCDLEISRRYGHSNQGAARFVRSETSAMDQGETGIYDLGTIAAANASDAMIEIADTAALVASRGGLPMLVGCDHTVSLAGLLGSIRDLDAAPVYVYFDAHFDLGRNCDPGDLLHNGGFVGELLRQRWACCAINIGGRSPATRLDYPETPRFFSIPASASAATIIRQLMPLAGERVYVSIDADVLDPVEAPNVPCPEPNGLSAATLLACCDWLGRHCKVVGADLTEILPTPWTRGSEQHLMACLVALRHSCRG